MYFLISHFSFIFTKMWYFPNTCKLCETQRQQFWRLAKPSRRKCPASPKENQHPLFIFHNPFNELALLFDPSPLKVHLKKLIHDSDHIWNTIFAANILLFSRNCRITKTRYSIFLGFILTNTSDYVVPLSFLMAKKNVKEKVFSNSLKKSCFLASFNSNSTNC